MHRVFLCAFILSVGILLASHAVAQRADETPSPRIPKTPPPRPRQDLFISGVYPHLTTYAVYSQNGAHYKEGHAECGIGAVVPWIGKLWMVNYAPHMPRGSEHKLYSIDDDLKLTIHPESVGGTPAGRMIHRQSNQLLVGHHLVDAQGNVRTIPPEEMPIRVTAIVQHLEDPANLVYYIDMEGSIWEANVHSLRVERLYSKPVPGWHSKGGYSGQGHLVISNNGERAAGSYRDLVVGGPAENDEEIGVLAEWDGATWRIIERRQYTDVTGPAGIHGGGDQDDPIWAIGWDRRSLRLKVRDGGSWYTYLLPKASLCNDARHGWYTEWPRIREITGGRWLMDMHGMFFDFPPTFSPGNTRGLAPVGSHLRYIPDFCDWEGRLVLATDGTSIQGNPMAGQPQSNLWFGHYEDLKTWGPASGYGGPWIEDAVAAETPSDPFLVAGFDHRVLHLATGRRSPAPQQTLLRTSEQQSIRSIPRELASLPRVTIRRGDWHQPAPGYWFEVNRPVTVYLAVDRRGDPRLDPSWALTPHTIQWGAGDLTDAVYVRRFPAGRIEIPGNRTEHTPDAFGLPHMAMVASGEGDLDIETSDGAMVTWPKTPSDTEVASGPVRFTVEVDALGDGRWEDYTTIEVPADGYRCHIFPKNISAVWIRLRTDRDAVVTAFLHQTAASQRRKMAPENQGLFAGLAEADAESALAARVYPAKRNRNLRVITGDDRYFEFTKADFTFEPDQPDAELAELLATEAEFDVDDASVILRHGGRTLRLPKGPEVFDQPFSSGWPRASREVQSERHLANIHGTFYEVPLITNGRPPAYELMRPVASHTKQISDYASWNGLLVLAGVGADAPADGHVFRNDEEDVALWFGAIDDLWKFGKPTGRGGPWKETSVEAGRPSDPYLMTGYDRKTLILNADVPTRVTAEIDIDHQSGWHRYTTFQLDGNRPVRFEFPEGFSAHWIRLVADRDCRATAQLIYQ